jgi:protein TonB
MKRILLTTLLLSAILATISSCKKEKEEQPLDKGLEVPFITEETPKPEETKEAPKDTIKDNIEEQPVVNKPIKEEKKAAPKNTKKQTTNTSSIDSKTDKKEYPPVGDSPEEHVTISNDDDTIYTAVSIKAEYPGGMSAFNKQFVSRFRIPDFDTDVKRVQVIVQFVVNLDGSLSDFVVARDPGYGTGREAVRVLKSMPNWIPAQLKGKTVRSLFTMPITIQVQ